MFTNTKRGSIIVEKQTVPDGAAGSFAFTGDAAGSIGDGGQITVGNLVPGTYTSTEAVQQGWALTLVTCNDANSTGSVPARGRRRSGSSAGETVKCTFTNSKLGVGAISVSKEANPTSIKEPGGPVTFNVTITNPSAVPIVVTNVVDDKFGDLDDDGGKGYIDVPINLAPGQSRSAFSFVGNVTGTGRHGARQHRHGVRPRRGGQRALRRRTTRAWRSPRG